MFGLAYAQSLLVRNNDDHVDVHELNVMSSLKWSLCYQRVTQTYVDDVIIMRGLTDVISRKRMTMTVADDKHGVSSSVTKTFSRESSSSRNASTRPEDKYVVDTHKFYNINTSDTYAESASGSMFTI